MNEGELLKQAKIKKEKLVMKNWKTSNGDLNNRIEQFEKSILKATTTKFIE